MITTKIVLSLIWIVFGVLVIWCPNTSKPTATETKQEPWRIVEYCGKFGLKYEGVMIHKTFTNLESAQNFMEELKEVDKKATESVRKAKSLQQLPWKEVAP